MQDNGKKYPASSELGIINPMDYPHWDDLIVTANDYSFFHSSGWAKVLCTAYRYTPVYFTLLQEGKLQALIPIMEVRSPLTGRRGVSLAFTDYCDPIVENRENFYVLLERIIAYGRECGWKYIELRGGQKFLPSMPASAKYLGHTLALGENEQDIFSSFRNSTRRNIKKAITEGVETKICTTLQSVREFYKLHCLTRKRHGLPPQPFHFFRNIYEFIISQNHGFVILASYQGRNVAGAVYFHFGDRALYKYGASDESYQHLRANNLVMWEAIKHYCHNNYSSFCFGRTDCDNEGLRQFKTGWGATEKDICYYKYDVGRGAFLGNDPDKKLIGKMLLKRMPSSILKGIGSIFYKHMG